MNTNELMLSTHVLCQITRCTKALLANITFIRFLVRVNTLVGFQSTSSTKTLLTHIAFVRFLLRVSTHVNFKITSITKTLLAHIAFVRFLLRVSTHVYGQCRWGSKHLLANITFARSLSLHSFSMLSTHVRLQTTRCTKTFLAHTTFIRFLLRVSTHVYGQCRWYSEHLLANLAKIKHSPRLRVLLIRRARFFSYLILLVFLLHHLRRQVFVFSRVSKVYPF